MCTELLPPGGYPIAVKYIIFQMKYIGYYSQTTDGRLSSTQTNTKVNCELLSQYVYLPLAQRGCTVVGTSRNVQEESR
jgi:hypothetical protein